MVTPNIEWVTAQVRDQMVADLGRDPLGVTIRRIWCSEIKAQSDFHTNNVQNDFMLFQDFQGSANPFKDSPTKLPQIYIFNRDILNSQTLDRSVVGSVLFLWADRSGLLDFDSSSSFDIRIR